MSGLKRAAAAAKATREMTAAEAWARFLPELRAVTVDNWTEDDYRDEPEFVQLAADIEAGYISPAVVDEIVTFCADVYVPGVGEKVGVATVPVIT